MDREAQLTAKGIAPAAMRGTPVTIDRVENIPYRVRVGVTGHRALPGDDRLVEQVRRALQRIRELAPSSPDTPVRLTAVSSLAEGADRLVAREILNQEDGLLEVALPLPAADYCSDFETSESRDAFKRLLAQARLVAAMPAAEKRTSAYEAAGEYVVERSDVLIALWDGLPARGPGGTAEIVGFARDRNLPLLWIKTEPPFELLEELGDGLSARGFQQLDEYNRQSVSHASLERAMESQANAWKEKFSDAGLDPQLLQPFCDWILPHYAKADELAIRYQRWFFRLGAAIFYLATGATAVVALQHLFFPEHPGIVLFEALFLLAVLAILTAGRRLRLHERWVSYRFLAEHFRTRFFVALVGSDPARARPFDTLDHPSGDWLERVLDEVWSLRPSLPDAAERIEKLRVFLAGAWINDQVRYQERSSYRNRRKHERLTWISVAIFAVTLVAAVLHVFGVGGHDSSFALDLLLLSIALPALAGAVRGIEEQREYERNAERSRHMVEQLRPLERRMREVPNLERARLVALHAESVMLSENREWFVVMQFHDFELHV